MASQAFPTSSSSSKDKPTRTIAILAKACAKVHRLAIESRITAAGFDILVSRQEEWAYPDDSDFLYEFFSGHSDAAVRRWIERLTGSPMHFMILERLDAVRTWKQLMGPDDGGLDDDDGDDGEDEDDGDGDGTESAAGTSLGGPRSLLPSSPSSSITSGLTLREAYGKALLYGSLTRHQAERQIAICAPEHASEDAIASLSMEYSALFENDDGDGGDHHGIHGDNLDQESSGLVHTPDLSGLQAASAIRQDDVNRAQQEGCVVITEGALFYDDKGRVFNKETGAHVALEEELLPDSHIAHAAKGTQSQPGQQKVFKARPVPASIVAPKVQPRLSRAAALRMGMELPAVPVRVTKASTEPQNSGPLGISGLPKATVVLPKSLAAPSIKPRANRASLARTTGLSNTSATQSQDHSPVRLRREVDFSSTPGHKRQGLKSEQKAVASLAKPTIAPRQNRASLARAAGGGSGGTNVAVPIAGRSRPTGRTVSSPSKSVGVTASKKLGEPGNLRGKDTVGDENMDAVAPERKQVAFDNTPGHRRKGLAGSFNLASLKAPSIAPRANRASLARSCHAGELMIGDNGVGAGAGRLAVNASLRPASPQKGELVAVGRECKPVDFTATPGHKRASSSVTIASLADPKIALRSNLAATRRLSVGGVGRSTTAARDLVAGSVGGRPSSAMDHGGAAKAGGNFRRSRPSSSAGMLPSISVGGGAHQDGQTPVGVMRAHTFASQPLRRISHPPSAFKAAGTFG